MALWNYDPYSTFVMETPRIPQDLRGLFEPEPLEYWPESSLLLSPFDRRFSGLPIRALRSRGIGSPAAKQIREVVSDKDKYQVRLLPIQYCERLFSKCYCIYLCFVSRSR